MVRYSKDSGVGILIDFGLAEVNEDIIDGLVQMKRNNPELQEEVGSTEHLQRFTHP